MGQQHGTLHHLEKKRQGILSQTPSGFARDFYDGNGELGRRLSLKAERSYSIEELAHDNACDKFGIGYFYKHWLHINPENKMTKAGFKKFLKTCLPNLYCRSWYREIFAICRKLNRGHNRHNISFAEFMFCYEIMKNSLCVEKLWSAMFNFYGKRIINTEEFIEFVLVVHTILGVDVMCPLYQTAFHRKFRLVDKHLQKVNDSFCECALEQLDNAHLQELFIVDSLMNNDSKKLKANLQEFKDKKWHIDVTIVLQDNLVVIAAAQARPISIITEFNNSCTVPSPRSKSNSHGRTRSHCSCSKSQCSFPSASALFDLENMLPTPVASSPAKAESNIDTSFDDLNLRRVESVPSFEADSPSAALPPKLRSTSMIPTTSFSPEAKNTVALPIVVMDQLFKDCEHILDDDWEDEEDEEKQQEMKRQKKMEALKKFANNIAACSNQFKRSHSFEEVSRLVSFH